jgi:NACalpha-BTF3-like transcription factor
MEDMNTQGHLNASQQLAGSGAGSTTALDPSRTGKGSENPDDVPELEAPEDDDPVDETGVDPKDIELVMAQVNCSRAKAVRVLKESSGDLINASVSISIRICGPTSDFFVLPISYGGERMILFASVGYCTSVKKSFIQVPLARPPAIYLSL